MKNNLFLKGTIITKSNEEISFKYIEVKDTVPLFTDYKIKDGDTVINNGKRYRVENVNKLRSGLYLYDLISESN